METVAAIQDDGYRVNLEVFSGPLDLLLYLIKKEEVDIYDIPIARITRQYLKYVEMIKHLDLEVAGEFILMAATLIRIKTRLLLPRDENDPEEADPREELILALVEYKKFKEAGEILREQALNEERNYVPPSPVSRPEAHADLAPASGLYDMMVAFREILKARRDETFHQVGAQDVSIEERIGAILACLAERQFATFRELFADIPRKIVAVVTFIAMLELARNKRIRIKQSIPFAELRVYRGEFFESGAEALKQLDLPPIDEPTTSGKRTV